MFSPLSGGVLFLSQFVARCIVGDGLFLFPCKMSCLKKLFVESGEGEGKMQIQIALCDDREEDVRFLEKAVRAWAEKRKYMIALRTYPSAESFLFDCEDHPPEILLLDIEMKGMNGVKLAQELRSRGWEIPLLFITGYPDFALQGYEVSAVHYLLKPVVSEKLEAALDRAWALCGRQEASVLLPVEGGSLRVPVGQIHFAEAVGHGCTVTTETASIDVRIGIAELEKVLEQAEPGRFLRTHRSYLVSVPHISRIGRAFVTLDGGAELPLSRSRYQAANQAFIRYWKEGLPWD